MQSDSANEVRRPQVMKRILKIISVSAVGVVVFFFGVGVGNGNIVFGSPTEQVSKELPQNLDYSSIEHIYDLLKSNYDGKLETPKLLEGLKQGLAKATGDPYTQFFNQQDAKEFDEELSGSFTGIGAELGENQDGNLIIVAPIEGFPASKAGVRPQDIIVSIDDTPTNGMTISEAVKRIRGPKDTTVKLRLLRNKSDDLSLTIKRDDIKIPSVAWSVTDDQTGYIKVSQFGQDTNDLMLGAAADFKEKGVKRVVLDLRSNPGGLLTTAVDMSSMWLPRGKTVLQEKRSGVVSDTYTSQTNDPVFKDMPTVVLINAGSASASEIVAGALRDNNVATIVGEKSYGKGSVQELRDLPGGSKIKITVARWYRPNGQNIDKKGITPDTEVKLSEADYKQNKDPQKDAAMDIVKKR